MPATKRTSTPRRPRALPAPPGNAGRSITLTHDGLLTDDQAAAITAAIVHSVPGGSLEEWTDRIHRLDIWGPTFRAFMGMGDSGGGIDEIQDDPASWGRARIAEPYVFRAQMVRSDAIASVPLRCWQVDRNGRRQAVDHVSIDILNRSVPMDPSWDAYVSGMEGLMCYTLLALDNFGRNCWQLAFSNPDSKGRRIPTEITWLTPSAFTPIHGYEVNESVPFAGVYYSTGGRRQRLTPDKVVYFTTPNPNDPIAGTSKISVLRNAINLRLYSVRSNADFFKNSMRPDWILSGDWKNTQENVESIKRGLRRHYTGESNREPLVIGEGATAHLLTTTQKDAEWTNMMRMVGEEIMAVYGVPVLYLNNFERATYENAKQARLMLWHDCLISETRRLAAQITRRYLWRFWPETISQNYEIAFDYGAVEGLTEDVGLLWERVKNYQDTLTKFIERRLMTPDQARMVLVQITESMGLDSTPFQGNLPDGQGSTLFVKWDDVPSDQAGIQAMMNINAARSANPLTGYLIENVPGATNAGTNALRGVAELQSREDQQLNQQAQMAAQARTQPANAPKALPGRESFASVEKRLTAKLKRFFQGLQRESLRNLRGDHVREFLYDRKVAEATLHELFQASDSEAIEVEVAQSVASALGDGDGDMADRVAAVFSAAINTRSAELASAEVALLAEVEIDVEPQPAMLLWNDLGIAVA